MATRFTTNITLSGKAVIGSVPKGTRAEGKANCIFCPLGPAHTQGWFLLRKKELDELDLSTTHTLNWIQSETDNDQGSNPTLTNLTFGNFYIRDAQRVLPGARGDSNALYLVELVDARWILNHHSDTEKLRYNPRSFGHQQDFLVTNNPNASWQDLVDDLWDACSLLSGTKTLPASLPKDGSPENLFYTGHSAWRALCTVLDYLDCALRHDVINRTYNIVQLGAPKTIPDKNTTLKWDLEPINSSIDTAATLNIYFPAHLRAFGQERDAERSSNWIVGEESVSKSEKVSIPGAKGSLALWDNLSAITDFDGSDKNSSERNTRASNRKTRYETRQSVVPRHRIHRGLHTDFLPNEQIRATLWRNWDDSEDTDNQLNGTVTEFIAKKELVTGFDSKRGHTDWISSPYVLPEKEPFLPTDFNRRTTPNYPRVVNVVQVLSPAAGMGVIIQTSNGLVEGLSRRFLNGNLVGLETCVIRFVDWEDIDLGQGIPVANGKCFIGRLCGMGQIPLSNVTAPLYLATLGEQTFEALPTITSGKINKGQTGSFKLLNADLTPSSVTVQANCDFSDIKANKRAVVSRLHNGRLVAMPGECT